MNFELPTELGSRFNSTPQKIRVITESWAEQNAFCPSCLQPLQPAPINHPATDFSCIDCSHSFELKSTCGSFGKKVVDGAYDAMSKRILSGTQPHLFLLSYSPAYQVRDFSLVPRFFLTLSLVERRKPLGDSARRRGWVGCNLLIGGLPPDGQIAYVRGSHAVEPADVRHQWNRSEFVQNFEPGSRGWLIAVMSCVRHIGKRHFDLNDVYAFEEGLQRQFPGNRNVRPKIRQQLQRLRDNGWLRFEGSGVYELTDHRRD